VNNKAAGSTSTLQSFNKDTVSVGVLEGTTAEDMAGVALPNAKIRIYIDDSRLFDDLIGGKLEAAVADSPRPQIVAKLYPTSVTCLCDTPLATYPAAFAVRRGGWKTGYWFKTTDWMKDL
jgi:polar amino acid transport system substrate-binding protein